MSDYISAVENAFRQLGHGKAELSEPMHIAGVGGMFHVKGAGLQEPAACVAVKVNGNFPGNRARHGLPTIQGAIILLDAEKGCPLALMDAVEITIGRTAAATAVAARYLARPKAQNLTICGCGDQSFAQVKHLAATFALDRIFGWDAEPAKVAALSDALGLRVTMPRTLREATLESDIIVTCTTSQSPILGVEDVSPGTFIAAVGADNPAKQELHPELLASASVYADDLRQCLAMGELHHASDVIAAGELADLVTGNIPGRTDNERITIFDSTGVAVQDVASARLAYERALERGLGLEVAL